MGFAVPAAMGAKVGLPDALVWAIDGDGCFQMTNQELATCAIEGIPVKIAIINNGNLGMVRQWQTLFYNERYSNTNLGDRKTELRGTRIPDFVKLAEAYGCIGLRCEGKEDVDAVIEQAMAINDQPVVIDFIVHQDAMVWPMVAAGTSNDDIKFARNMAPDWEDRMSQGLARPVSGADNEQHTLSVLVENKPGVLVRIAGLFSRRGFNIDSLAVGPTEHPEISRMTIVVDCEEHPLEQVTKQLNKLINVLKIVELEPAPGGAARADPDQGPGRRWTAGPRCWRLWRCSARTSSTWPWTRSRSRRPAAMTSWTHWSGSSSRSVSRNWSSPARSPSAAAAGPSRTARCVPWTLPSAAGQDRGP